MRKKQERFSENERRSNVIQEGKPIFQQIKGRWRSDHFKNEMDLVIELGCGRGEYTVGMARMDSKKNYVGVDIKGDRIWKGSKIAEAEGLTQVAFLRTKIQDLEAFFERDEVTEIWITFPDPRPKKRDIKRRLTHPRFLETYRRILVPDGRVHLKTDNDIFFSYTLETVKDYPGVQDLIYTHDLYQSDLLDDILAIPTHYEELFSRDGQTIKYLSFGLT